MALIDTNRVVAALHTIWDAVSVGNENSMGITIRYDLFGVDQKVVMTSTSKVPPSSIDVGTLWIVGDYIIMIQTLEKPFYLVEIKDAVLSHNMREVFKKLWKEEK